MRCDKCKREMSDDEPAWRLWRRFTLCADCKPDADLREPQPRTRCGRPVHDYDTTLGIVYCGTRCHPRQFRDRAQYCLRPTRRPIDAKVISKQIGVRFVLEGSLQPSGNRVRVNAQLIDADSGARVWAEQFDTARSDLLQMQDEIVKPSGRAMFYQTPRGRGRPSQADAAANADAEDLALQCQAVDQKAGYLGKEAEAAYRLCEQALAIDPNNALALSFMAVKFAFPVGLGCKRRPESRPTRAEEVNAQALASDPNFAGPHQFGE